MTIKQLKEHILRAEQQLGVDADVYVDTEGLFYSITTEIKGVALVISADLPY